MNRKGGRCDGLRLVATFILVLSLSRTDSKSFYLQGVAPVDYEDGSPVELKVNKLTSVQTQLPYEYYSLPFCRPARIEQTIENIGEALYGDRIENSRYEIRMKIEEKCKVLCTVTYNKAEIRKFATRIKQDYRVNWILDNLPVAVPVVSTSEGTDVIKTYQIGFPLGYSARNPEDGETEQYIHNHVSLKIMYHSEETPSGIKSRVVGAEAFPSSIQHSFQPGESQNTVSCVSNPKLSPQSVQHPATISWTYDVNWEPSAVKWASRWDIYLMVTDSKIHWFSIINSLIMILLLTGIIAVIFARTLHQDLVKYNTHEIIEELESNPGWKILHGDVFRKPSNSIVLCVIVGSGAQIFGMSLVTLIFAILGFLSPANRGGLISSALLLYVMMGLLAGYVSARIYRLLRGTRWKTNTLATAVLFPGLIFAMVLILNTFAWSKKSSGAIPLTSFVTLFALWVGVSLPLVFVGTYFGYTQGTTELANKASPISRPTPPQPWFLHRLFTLAVGGIFPFGAVFVELYFILSSIWQHQFYYLFGILGLVFLILVLTTAEVSIVLCYLQLSYGDCNWMWRSVCNSGSAAIYFLGYSIYYFKANLEIIAFIPGVLFFGYTSIMAILFFLLTASVGFISSLFFIHKIYSSIHLD